MLNYKRCLTQDSNHFGACFHLAKRLQILGEHTRAIKYFKHATKIDSSSVQALFGLAKAIHMAAGQPAEECIPIYEEVVRRDEKNYKAFTQLGLLHNERKEYDKAATYLNKAL